MIEMSEEITEFAPAFAKAQGAMSNVLKDSKNPHFKSSYAGLDAVVDMIRKPLAENGLSFIQSPGNEHNSAIPITTMILHASGQWMRDTYHMPLAQRSAQGVGSAITYGRRYALMALLGIAPEDDDGNQAAGGNERGPVRQVEDRRPQPRQEEASALSYSERMADTLVAKLMTRRGAKAVNELANQPAFKERFGELDREDMERVERVADERRALAELRSAS